MSEQLNLTINLDKLTIGDLETIAVVAGEGDKLNLAKIPAVIELMNRAVEGGVRHLPMDSLGQIMNAMAAEMGKVGNPSDQRGNSAAG